jgi:zinc transporter
MQDIADRLGRGLDEIDSCIARTAVMADEIAQVMQESLARRTYTMSLMAMVFLPSTFLTGLFGVNLGGIPGGAYRYGFTAFCVMLVVLIGVLHGGCIVVNGCKFTLFHLSGIKTLF